VFKVAIKANGETIDEEITNLFNFMLENNASYYFCNNYVRVHPNDRFTYIKQAFYG
jgi:hypothetical protein